MIGIHDRHDRQELRCSGCPKTLVRRSRWEGSWGPAPTFGSLSASACRLDNSSYYTAYHSLGLASALAADVDTHAAVAAQRAHGHHGQVDGSGDALHSFGSGLSSYTTALVSGPPRSSLLCHCAQQSPEWLGDANVSLQRIRATQIGPRPQNLLMLMVPARAGSAVPQVDCRLPGNCVSAR